MDEMGFIRAYEHEEMEDDDDLTRLVRQIGWVVGTDREGKTRYHYDLETARNLLGNYVAAQVAKARELAIEEHEAALCPEDMGCAEYILALKMQVAQAREEEAKRVRVVDMAPLRAEIERLREAGLAYQELSSCYRMGSRPTERLFKRLDEARAALAPSAPVEPCPACGGAGWTAEHSLSPGAHDEEGNCLGACPEQVPCETCNGTGLKPALEEPKS